MSDLLLPKEHLTSARIAARRGALLLASGLAGAFALALALSLCARTAGATTSVTCTSVTELDVDISGGAAPGDALTISVSDDQYEIVFDGSPACTNATYPVGSNSIVAVTDTGSPAVPVTFQPGDANGETFIGQSGASNTLDLTGESSSLPFTDSMNADTLTAEGSAASEPSSGSPFTVSFANVTQVDGSPGGTDFQPGTATAPNSVDFVGSTGSAATNVLDSYFTIVRSLGAQPRYLKAEVTAQASDALAAESAERRRRVVLVVDEAREIDRGFAGPSGAC